MSRPPKSQIPLRAVFFDWDGTLLDSFTADANAYALMFEALGMDWSVAKLKQHYSPDWHRVYRAARLPKLKWTEADRLWMQFYGKHQPVLQAGARRVLCGLEKKYTLALVSSGSRVRVLRQVRQHQLSELFQTKVCCEDAVKRKPHPAPLQLALDRLRLLPPVCVYIGDAPEDIEMAHRAGMRAIGVLGGSPVPKRLRLAKPDAFVDDIRELPALLKTF